MAKRSETSAPADPDRDPAPAGDMTGQDGQGAPQGQEPDKAPDEAPKAEDAPGTPSAAPDGQAPAPTPKPEPKSDPKPADDGRSENVRVTVKKTIGFDGVVIRPDIDDSGRGSGRPAIVKPVEAVIPRRMVASYGPEYVEIIASAPPDAKIGRA